MYLEEVLPKVLANVKSTPQKRRLDDYDRKVISKASKKTRLEDDSSAYNSDLEEADDEFLKKKAEEDKKEDSPDPPRSIAKPHECFVCDKSFKTEGILSKHHLQIHGIPDGCEDIETKNQPNLNDNQTKNLSEVENPDEVSQPNSGIEIIDLEDDDSGEVPDEVENVESKQETNNEKANMGEKVKSFCCNECPQSFELEFELAMHLKKHNCDNATPLKKIQISESFSLSHIKYELEDEEVDLDLCAATTVEPIICQSESVP